MNKYYIYAHIRKDTNTIFYIGKGSKNRAYFKSNRSLFWKRIVEKCGYEVIFLLKDLSEEEAYKAEITFIMAEKLKGNCEANFTNGGDGVRVSHRWWNNKISESLKGKKTPKGNLSKSYKDFATKEELIELYVNKKLPSTEIQKLYNVSYTTVCFRLKEFGITLRKCGKESSKIKCTTDNIIFNSINDAAKHYGLYRENIRKVLNGKYNHTGNKVFVKLNNKQNEIN
jgi:hypothetical protein